MTTYMTTALDTTLEHGLSIGHMLYMLLYRNLVPTCITALKGRKMLKSSVFYLDFNFEC